MVEERRVSVVTGAASGIGRATAQRLARRGDHVIAIDRSAAALDDAAREIAASGGSVEARAADVLDAESIHAIVDAAVRSNGRLDYIFSNAGVAFRASLAEMPLAEWDRVIQTHVTGAFICCRAVLPHMLSKGAGAIVVTSSDFAVIGMRNAANYAAAKTALYSLAKSLAVEFASSRIRVNAVGPGPIDTPFLAIGRTQVEWQETLQQHRERLPMRRLGTPGEVASVVEFLLSDRASYITGQLLQPNGGQVMW